MNFNATFIGQLVAFAVFVWFTMKFVWPLLLKQMEEREARIADGLAAAEQGKKDFAAAQEESVAEVDKGKDQAAKIISKAQKRHDEIIDEAKEYAKLEAERIKKNALSEIEQEKEKVRQEFKAQLGSLVIAGAEQVLMREVDRNAHNDLLEQLSDKL